MKKLSVVLVIGVVFSLLAVNAFADNDDEMNVNHFRPSIFGGDFISFDDANGLDQLGFGGMFLIDYAASMYSYFVDGEHEFDFISEAYTAHLSAAFGAFDWWNIGVYIPLHYLRHLPFDDLKDAAGEGNFIYAEGEVDQETTFVVGDLVAKFKFPFLRQELHWINMALIPYATFPTGDPDYWVGEGRVTGGADLSFEHDFKVLNVGLMGGYLYRGNNDLLGVEISDAFKWALGVSRGFDNGLSFSVEYTGTQYNVADSSDIYSTPQEALATLRYEFSDGPRIIAGAGPGLSDGVGTPVYRLVAGVDYYKKQPKAGTLVVRAVDEENNPLTVDVTVTGPENRSGVTYGGEYKDILKAGDYTVNGTKEGYQPATEATNIKGGSTVELLLVLKAIPKPKTVLQIEVIETHTGDTIDSVIVFNKGLESEDSRDNPSGVFEAEWTEGTYNLHVSSEGHESKELQVTVVPEQTTMITVKLNKKIDMIGKVYFATASHVILKKSYPVLDDVVSKIKKLGSFNKITIEGHTDSRGNDEYNWKLSQRRANSVKQYLINHGIDAGKLVVKAYGESKPIASNETKMGRAENRRVEFIVE